MADLGCFLKKNKLGPLGVKVIGIAIKDDMFRKCYILGIHCRRFVKF
jgi:hypothetical protein